METSYTSIEDTAAAIAINMTTLPGDSEDSEEEQRTTAPSTATTRTPSPSAEDTVKYGPLLTFGIDDVQLSETEDQPTVKGNRNVNTFLTGIGNQKTINLNSRHLRNWAIREKMGARDGNKTSVCVAIADFVKQYRWMKAQGQGRDLQAMSDQDDGGGNNRIGGRGRKRSASLAASANKKARAKKCAESDKNDIFRSIAESTKTSAEATKSKNHALSYSALSVSLNPGQQGLDGAKNKKHKAMKGLKDHAFTDGNNARAPKIVEEDDIILWACSEGGGEHEGTEPSMTFEQLLQRLSQRGRLFSNGLVIEEACYQQIKKFA